ncbi:MAG TPA: winged helix-turn-helix domain-containing protein [Rhizomicrobium sp.]|jgi:DNA-binding transcriptional ArsR family regulator|nr:winged helix-turn-helix domain-containing protein [Rhizomicrobium sp.]
MKDGPSIAPVAALAGDPARANMLAALSGGMALTASELAGEAGVTLQTASSHLAKLASAGLISATRQGRHRYFRLADDDVAQMLEAIMSVAARTGQLRTRPGPRDPALRRARVCYDHLAGEMGVQLLDNLLSLNRIVRERDDLSLTKAGADFMNGFRIDVDRLSNERRPLCRACLDWSMRRHHLGGALGAALLKRFQELRWVSRVTDSRTLRFTPSGEAAFRQIFSGEAASSPSPRTVNTP